MKDIFYYINVDLVQINETSMFYDAIVRIDAIAEDIIVWIRDV